MQRSILKVLACIAVATLGVAPTTASGELTNLPYSCSGSGLPSYTTVNVLSDPNGKNFRSADAQAYLPIINVSSPQAPIGWAAVDQYGNFWIKLTTADAAIARTFSSYYLVPTMPLNNPWGISRIGANGQRLPSGFVFGHCT